MFSTTRRSEADVVKNNNSNGENSSNTIRVNHRNDNSKNEKTTKNKKKSERDMVYIYSTLIAGVGSGAIASITCAPFDLIKTRIQVWGGLKNNKQKMNLFSIVKDVYTKEGYTGFFRGLGASLVTVPVFWGIYFPLYDETKRYWKQHYPDVEIKNPAMIHCGSAVFAGAISDIICNPMFVVRTRLQTEALHNIQNTSSSTTTNNNTGTTTGIARTIKSLYKEGGIPIFWRGMSANLIGLSHVAVQFPAYERLKEYFLENKRNRLLQRHHNNSNNSNNNSIVKSSFLSNNISAATILSSSERNDVLDDNVMNVKLSPIDLILASGFSKLIAMVLTYPHEVIRSRMMDARGSNKRGLFFTCQKVYKSEGIKGFYSGLPVSMIRVIPNCCVTFMTYELFVQYAKDRIIT